MTDRAEAFTSALDAALRYADLGWPVFPCRPDKKPLTEHGFLQATTDHDQIVKWWRRWPDAQIGVATEAAGLCVIDLDISHGPDGATVKDGIASFSRLIDDHGRHGCGLIASTPRGGRHYVYLMPAEVVTSGSDILTGSGIDVRAGGAYIIVPSPSSPGRDWIAGDPFDHQDGQTDIAPMPDWVEELVRVGREHVSGASAASESGRCVPIDAQQERRIREALDWIENDSRKSWLKVGMALKSTGAREQAFALWVEWSRRTATAEAVHPKFNERDQIYQWKSIHEYRLDGSEITISSLFWMAKEAGWAPSIDDEVAIGVEDAAVRFGGEPADRDDEPDKAPATKPFPLELMNCPGLVGEIANWMARNSTRRQPALCLASAIVSLGALLGRRVATPTDLRTNVYALGIGETASGKGVGIKLPQLLFAHAGLARFIGPGEWKSDSGMRSALVAEPSHVALLDEFTKTLATMSGRQVPPHIMGIKRYILDLFDKANGVHLAPAYADRKLNAPVQIQEPNLGIYGTGVPAELFSSLDRGALSDGFMNRFLCFFVDDQQPRRQKVGRVKPPDELVAALKALDVATKPKGNLQSSTSDVAVASGCRIVPYEPAAEAYFEQLIAATDERIAAMRTKGDPLVDLWVRFAEHVAKLALVRSVADDPSRPTSVADLAWACDLVTWCTERTMQIAEQRVADSPQEALTKRVLRVVTAAGAKGISASKLTRATQWLRRSDRKDILQTLIESGQVQAQVEATATNPRTTYLATSTKATVQ